jgi:glyceraldehyde-3-phosphate dehydrogenase/erythrose-4-phosphate dehydrogenase
VATSVGINGFGRVGRSFMRAALERDDLTVAAVNEGDYDPQRHDVISNAPWPRAWAGSCSRAR